MPTVEPDAFGGNVVGIGSLETFLHFIYCLEHAEGEVFPGIDSGEFLDLSLALYPLGSMP